ncbi:MAG: hypothetical protein ACPGO5_01605 [Patescibacteria group bacterium]
MKKIPLPKIPIKKVLSVALGQIKHIAIILSIVLLLSFGWFLYQNFYTTIISAREIVILESEVSSNNVDIHLLQRVEKSHAAKQEIQIKSWGVMRSAFSDTPATNNDLQLDDPFSNEVTPRVTF